MTSVGRSWPANLFLVNLTGADLTDANLMRADLTNARLARIINSSNTTWPDRFTPPSSAVSGD